MKFTVYGAGAIGGIAGAYLARAGEDVLLVDKVPEHVRAMNQQGLHIYGALGEFTVPVQAITPTDLQSPLEVVLLAVKSQDTADALEVLHPHLDQNSVIVSLQNGLNEERIAEAVGTRRTMGGYVGYGGDYKGPGLILQAGPGDLYIGELDGQITERLLALQRALNHAHPTHVTDNIWGHLWSKQCYASEGFFTALADAPVAEVMAPEKNKRTIAALVAEAVEVPLKLGVRLEAHGGFDPMAYLPQTPAETQALFDLLDRTAQSYARSAKTHTGVWHDLVVRKRKTEVDYLVGDVVRRGQAIGLKMSLNSALMGMIHEIENGRRSMGWHNFDELSELVRSEGRTLP